MKDVQQLLLETNSGKGLLDARALWASMVGPHRLAMAAKNPVNVFSQRTAQIHKNLGASNAYVFVGVAVPADLGLATLQVVFGVDDTLGVNNGAPYILTPQLGGGGFGPNGFMQLLMPGEDLYMQIVGAGSPAESRVTVAKVFF